MKRNRYKPSPEEREKVRVLAGFGYSIEDIALVLDRGVPTIRRLCRRELRDGVVKLNAKAIEILYKISTQTDAKTGQPIGSSAQVTALSLWLKIRAGWLAGEEKKPVPTNNNLEPVTLSSLSTNELKLLEEITQRVERAAREEGGAVPNRLAGESNGHPSTN